MFQRTLKSNIQCLQPDKMECSLNNVSITKKKTFLELLKSWFRISLIPVGTEFLCLTGVLGVPGVLDGLSHVVSEKQEQNETISCYFHLL